MDIYERLNDSADIAEARTAHILHSSGFTTEMHNYDQHYFNWNASNEIIKTTYLL